MIGYKYIQVIFILLLPSIIYTQILLKTPDTTQNAAKRFTLQDLFSGQNNEQVATAPQEPQHQTESANTQIIDISTLLAAAQKAAANNQQTSQFSNNKPIDVDLQSDKNGNYNLADLPGITKSAVTDNNADHSISMADLQSLIAKQNPQQNAQNVVKEEVKIGKEKLELETAGKRATRYALAKGADGGLNLVPVVEGAQQADGNKYQVLQSKGYEEKGSSRQQMQLTTLSQALYSPFPSDQNTLHLHLKGKDGKDGKAGTKGSMGPFGPKGPEGAKGAQGDAGTCSSQINGLFECTPDELDSLSNRVDYLEKICHKVETGAKKHKIHSNLTKSKVESKEHHDEERKETEKAREKESSKSEESKEEKEQESAKENEKKETEHVEKEVLSENKRREKTEKAQEEKETAKNVESNVETTGDKKHFRPASERYTFRDPATAALKSMIDVRAKLKISELDLLDRIKQAQEGVMKTL